MAAFARTELDLVGMARQDNQAAMTPVRHPQRQADRARRVPARRGSARRPTTRSSRASSSSTTPARRRSRARSTCPAGVADTGDLEAFLAERRGGPVHLRAPQRGEKRELMDLATRNASETLAREQAPLAGRPRQDPGGARAARGRRSACPGRRCASSATTSATSRARHRSAAWSCSRTASRARGEYRRFRIRTVEGPNDFASHQEVLRRRFRTAQGRRGGQRGGAALGDARPRHRRWRQGPGAAPPRSVLDELGLHDLPLAGLAKEREELFLPGRPDADPAAADLVGAVPRPATARRGAPVRDHVPPRPCATEGRSARRSTTCPASGPKRKRELLKVFGSIKRVREAPGRADRRRARHRPGARGPDQGDAGGLNRAAGARRGPRRDVPCTIPPVCEEPAPSSSCHHRPARRSDRTSSRTSGSRTRRSPDGRGGRIETKLGLDLEGGLRVEYQALPGRPDPRRRRHGRRSRTSSSAASTRRACRSRSSSSRAPTGSSSSCRASTDVDAVRRLVGSDRPGSTSSRSGTTPAHERARSSTSTVNTPLFGGDQVTVRPRIGPGPEQGGLAVNFSLRNEAPTSARSCSPTTRRAHAASTSRSPSTARSSRRRSSRSRSRPTAHPDHGRRLGGFPATEANDLVTVLKFGSLPFPIEELSSEQISATLGEQFLTQSLLAGGCRDRARDPVHAALLPAARASWRPSPSSTTRSWSTPSSGSCR